MTTEQIRCMLDAAYEAGMTDYVVWGGEPLLRNDLPQILAYANQRGLDATVITNGSRLIENIGAIAENLYGLILSIDHPDPEIHDKLRRRRGLFNRAMEGLKMAKKYDNLNILLNCVINKENLNCLERMAQLAKETGVKITFEMMELIKNYNEDLAPTREETSDAALQLLQLKGAGYPIANSASYFEALAKGSRYSCQVPKVLVTVEWDGKVRLCSNIAEDAKPLLHCELGNIKEKGFKEIFHSQNYNEYVKAAEVCWKCNLSYPREIAAMYSLNREAIGNFVSRIM